MTTIRFRTVRCNVCLVRRFLVSVRRHPLQPLFVESIELYAALVAVMVVGRVQFALRELYQAVENAELEFEFHTVHKPLVDCLDVIKTRVFEPEDRHVEEDDDDINCSRSRGQYSFLGWI